MSVTKPILLDESYNAKMVTLNGYLQTIANNSEHFGMPIKSSTASPEWDTEIRLGTLAANQTLTLPAADSGYNGEIRALYTQDASTQYTFTITVNDTSTQTITDGTNTGTSIVITSTASKNVELSIMFITSTLIGVVIKEW